MIPLRRIRSLEAVADHLGLRTRSAPDPDASIDAGTRSQWDRLRDKPLFRRLPVCKSHRRSCCGDTEVGDQTPRMAAVVSRCGPIDCTVVSAEEVDEYLSAVDEPKRTHPPGTALHDP
jgi:hypothetical protein